MLSPPSAQDHFRKLEGIGGPRRLPISLLSLAFRFCLDSLPLPLLQSSFLVVPSSASYVIRLPSSGWGSQASPIESETLDTHLLFSHSSSTLLFLPSSYLPASSQPLLSATCPRPTRMPAPPPPPALHLGSTSAPAFSMGLSPAQFSSEGVLARQGSGSASSGTTLPEVDTRARKTGSSGSSAGARCLLA